MNATKPHSYTGLVDGSTWRGNFKKTPDEEFDAAITLVEEMRPALGDKLTDKYIWQLELRNKTTFGIEQILNEAACDAGESVRPSKIEIGMIHPIFGEVTKVGSGVEFAGSEHAHYFDSIYGSMAVVLGTETDQTRSTT